jgi:hypothetical protein
MAEIQLSDFVKDVLVEIARGVRSANDELKNSDKGQYQVFSLRHNQGDSSKIPGIRFDVAVTAATQHKDKTGFFVALASIGAGANTEKSNEKELAHRIQFEIGVASDWM